jgi:hypothetical protein
VDEHVLAAVVANDEAEALLRIEEFDDALALADDLGRHSATAAAAEPAAAAAEAATAAAITAAAATAAEAATAAAITATAATAAVAKAATEPGAVAWTTVKACELFTTTETVALVTAATTAVTLTPSIEPHEILTLLCPKTEITNALGPWRNRSCPWIESAFTGPSLQEKRRLS